MNTQYSRTSPNHMNTVTDIQARDTTLPPSVPRTAPTAAPITHEQQKELSTVAVLGYN